MKLLLDENLPHDLRHFLPGHEVFTAAYMRWKGVKNGQLLAKAAAAGFDALVTLDSGIEFEHNLAQLPCSVVILRAPSNRLDDLLPFVTRLLETLATLGPKKIVHVGQS
jgi:predicted nuclease of predicted toxin-antitoxin system